MSVTQVAARTVTLTLVVGLFLLLPHLAVAAVVAVVEPWLPL